MTAVVSKNNNNNNENDGAGYTAAVQGPGPEDAQHSISNVNGANGHNASNYCYVMRAY